MVVGLKGVFTFSAPYEKYNDNRIWQLTGTVMLRDAVESGDDIKRDIYEFHGMTEGDYDQDWQGNVSICTLVSGSERVRIPETRIVAQPKLDGVVYREYVVGIKIGKFPVNYPPLTTLGDKLVEFVQSILGITPIVIVDGIGYEQLYSDVDSAHYLAGIEGNTTLETNYLKVLRLENEISMLRRELQLRDEHIINAIAEKM